MKDTFKMIDQWNEYICDSRNDGFSQWETKQQLYKVLWAVQNHLNNAPEFHGEKEWLKNHGR